MTPAASFQIILTVLVAMIVGNLYVTWKKQQRAIFIREYPFPKGLFDKFEKRRPGLSRKDTALTARALRKFFLAYLSGRCLSVAMPSQAVDDLWHEFILYTREYQLFCNRAFGGFLHHTPAAVMAPGSSANSGLRRVWWHCCKEENIDARAPTRLPLLFAIDSKLKLADGFFYVPDCTRGVRRKRGVRRNRGASDTFCATSFSDSSVDGGLDGFGSSGGDASGDGGSGDGGGGCGGGGCGGGGGD